jgi:hypothetical protein
MTSGLCPRAVPRRRISASCRAPGNGWSATWTRGCTAVEAGGPQVDLRSALRPVDALKPGDRVLAHPVRPGQARHFQLALDRLHGPRAGRTGPAVGRFGGEHAACERPSIAAGFRAQVPLQFRQPVAVVATAGGIQRSPPEVVLPSAAPSRPQLAPWRPPSTRRWSRPARVSTDRTRRPKYRWPHTTNRSAPAAESARE